jgi:hypothetical protein
MKKSYYIASILVLAVLVLGACSNILQPPGSETRGDTGFVLVSTGVAGRTLLPGTPVFDKYDLKFIPSAGEEVSFTGVTNLSAPIELPHSTWTLELTGYLGDDPAASGTSAAFVVGASPVTVPVSLRLLSLSGTGTLSYAITNASGLTLDEASLTLSLLGGSDPNIVINLLDGGLTGAESDVPSGYYLLSLSLQSGFLKVLKTDVAHIYDTLTTPFAWTFAAADFAYRNPAEVTKVWLVGDITNWLTGDGKTPIEMTKDGNTGIYTWTGDLGAGYLKFSGDAASPAGYTGLWFCPVQNTAVDCEALNDPDELPVYFGANKNSSWQIVHAGTYEIGLDPAAEKVTFKRTADLAPPLPDEMWIVGGVPGSSWTLPVADTAKMTSLDNGVFTWTNTFSDNSYFRFTSNNLTGSDTSWFAPAVNNTEITVGTSQSIEYVLGTCNSSWKLSTGGEYTVTLNTDNLTLLVAPPPPQVTGVSVSPSGVTVEKGTTQQFSASVTGLYGPAQTVSWSIVETPTGGTTGINSSGELTVDAGETLETLTVRATSTVNTAVYGDALVTLVSPGTPAVLSITLSPATATVVKGETRQFTPTVTVINGAAQTVSWSIDEAAGTAAGTSITGGLLTVDADEELETLTVRATSTVAGFTTISGTATVTVSPPLSGVDFILSGANFNSWSTDHTAAGAVHMTESSYRVYTWSGLLSGQFRFHGDSSNWGPSSYTTLATGGGTYPVVSGGSNQTFNMAAGAYYTLTLNLNTLTLLVALPDPVVEGVSVTPPAPAVEKGTTQQFSASVTGLYGPAQTVSWSIVETNKAAGTSIDSSGELTVDADEELETLTVRATSTVNIAVYGDALVTLAAAGTPAVLSITLNPATATVVKGETQQFTPTVTVLGGAAQTVIWSIDETSTGATTGIDSSGLLTIDAGETLETLTVRATSTVVGFTDISGTATVTVTGFAASGFDVGLYGGATPGQWAWPPGVPNTMTDAGSGVFTWTGNLTSGNTVQFPSTASGPYGANNSTGTWYGWMTGGAKAITLGQEQDVETYTGSRNGFTVAAAGNYTITLDTVNLTVLFVQNP